MYLQTVDVVYTWLNSGRCDLMVEDTDNQKESNNATPCKPMTYDKYSLYIRPYRKDVRNTYVPKSRLVHANT